MASHELLNGRRLVPLRIRTRSHGGNGHREPLRRIPEVPDRELLGIGDAERPLLERLGEYRSARLGLGPRPILPAPFQRVR
jgi:hypothetical protein